MAEEPRIPIVLDPPRAPKRPPAADVVSNGDSPCVACDIEATYPPAALKTPAKKPKK